MASKLVFPQDHDTDETSWLARILRDAGFSDFDAEWLIRVLRRPDCFGHSEDASEFKEGFVDRFEQDLPLILEKAKPEDRQTRLALLFGFMLSCGPVYYSIELRPDVQGAWVSEFRRHAGFRAKHLDLRTLNSMKDASAFLFGDLIPHLFPADLPLTEVVNIDRLVPVQRKGCSSNDFDDHGDLEYWLIWRFQKDAERRNIVSLETLLPAVAELPPDTLGMKVLGLLNAIGDALNMANALYALRLDPLNRGWRIVARELIPFLELIHEKQPDADRARSPLLKAWWRLSVAVYGRTMGGLRSELSAELRSRLIESAVMHFGFLRKVLRETPETFAGKDSTGEIADYYHEAFNVLCIFAPPWKRLKPLLLAFTEMAVPAVASDLRPWPESDREPPPHPYNKIPLWIEIAMYPQNLRDELENDPYLQDLREEFAMFCLGRLKTKSKETSGNTSNDFVEPRPHWRRCYVQALATLRVNPGGRAHRTVSWLLENDPDDEVRDLAKKARRRIRHLDRGKPNLDDGASPRRPLFEAFWWLRQAHLLTLGKEIDAAGAMRTRRRELHRTREKDDLS